MLLLLSSFSFLCKWVCATASTGRRSPGTPGILIWKASERAGVIGSWAWIWTTAVVSQRLCLADDDQKPFRLPANWTSRGALNPSWVEFSSLSPFLFSLHNTRDSFIRDAVLMPERGGFWVGLPLEKARRCRNDGNPDVDNFYYNFKSCHHNRSSTHLKRTGAEKGDEEGADYSWAQNYPLLSPCPTLVLCYIHVLRVLRMIIIIDHLNPP